MQMKMPTLVIRRPVTPQTLADIANKPLLVSRGRGQTISPFFQWWTHLTRTERIVSMSLVIGGVVAIINSITWATAVSYMTRQKAKAQIAASPVETATILMEPERDRAPAMR